MTHYARFILGSQWKGTKSKENKEKCEINRIWSMRTVYVVPITIDVWGLVCKYVDKYLKKIVLECQVELLQNVCLLGEQGSSKHSKDSWELVEICGYAQ